MAKRNNGFFRAPSNVIVDALKESTQRVKQLEAEVARLKKELSKYKTQNAQQRQKSRSLEGQLAAAKAKVVSLQKGLKVQKARVKKARIKQEDAEKETARLRNFIKKLQPKMSKDEVFELYRDSNYRRF